MVDVFLAVLPVFLILLVGMVVDRLHVLPESFSSQLSQYVFKIAMPCLLFRLVAGADAASLGMAGFWGGMLLAQFCVFGLGFAAASRGFTRCSTTASMVALACACSNSGFLGLPIIDSLLPGNHEALVVAGLACVMPPLVLVAAQSLIEMRQQQDVGAGIAGIVLRAVVFNPFVVATVCGAGVSLSGFGIWTPMDRVLGLIGSTGAPCALMALGLDMWRKMEIARRATSPHRVVRQSGIILVKLVVHPLLAWAFMASMGVSGVWLAVGVLMSGTSTAVMAYVLAEVYHTIPEECALAMVITAFLSLFTIPVLALALQAAGYM